MTLDLHKCAGMSFFTPETNRLWSDAGLQRRLCAADESGVVAVDQDHDGGCETPAVENCATKARAVTRGEGLEQLSEVGSRRRAGERGLTGELAQGSEEPDDHGQSAGWRDGPP